MIQIFREFRMFVGHLQIQNERQERIQKTRQFSQLPHPVENLWL
jgi:hypothetical protein